MKLGSNVAAIVTGGASGLGAATATGLAEAGCKVAILDMNRDAGEELAKSIGAIFCYCDVTSDDTVSIAIDLARTVMGRSGSLLIAPASPSARKRSAATRKRALQSGIA